MNPLSPALRDDLLVGSCLLTRLKFVSQFPNLVFFKQKSKIFSNCFPFSVFMLIRQQSNTVHSSGSVGFLSGTFS